MCHLDHLAGKGKAGELPPVHGASQNQLEYLVEELICNVVVDRGVAGEGKFEDPHVVGPVPLFEVVHSVL